MVRFRELYKGEKEPVLLSGRTSTGRSGDQYYFIYETVAEESRPLFIVLRHHTPNSPICLSEEIRQDLRLIANTPLIQRREKGHSRGGKSAFT